MSRRSSIPGCPKSRRLAAVAGLLLMILGLGSIGAGAALAQVVVIVPVDVLLTAPARYDGATITVEGELIGDYGFRPTGMMWTQLNDDSYARSPVLEGGELTGSNVGIALRMPAELAEGLSPPGGYRLRGPIVHATGVWRFHDAGRQGETYLDVSYLTMIEPGIELSEGPHTGVLISGIVVLLIGLGAWFRYVWIHRRA